MGRQAFKFDPSKFLSSQRFPPGWAWRRTQNDRVPQQINLQHWFRKKAKNLGP